MDNKMTRNTFWAVVNKTSGTISGVHYSRNEARMFKEPSQIVRKALVTLI